MRYWSRILSFAVLLAAVAGCGRFGPPGEGESGDEEDGDGQRPELVVPVEVVSAKRGQISDYYDTNTRVEAERKVEVHAEGTGECRSIEAEEGDRVEKGDVLAELDKREARASVSQARVRVSQQRSDYERAKELWEAGLVSDSEYESAYYTYEQGKEDLQMQEVRLDQLTVKAPLSGIVTQRYIQEGMLVSSGSPVYTIVDPQSFAVTINVPEQEIPRLSKGQMAQVRIDAYPDEVFEARIRRINPAIDPATGTVKVVLEFHEADRSRLRESAFARVKLVMDTREDALIIPKDAILEENARKFVYVVRPAESAGAAPSPDAEPEPESVEMTSSDSGGTEDASGDGRKGLFSSEVEAAADDEESESGDPPETETETPAFTAERVEVRLGLEDADSVEIRDGLSEDDLVVINGQHTLKEESKVRITNPTQEIMEKAGLSSEAALEAAKAKSGDEDDAEDGGRRRGRFGR